MDTPENTASGPSFTLRKPETPTEQVMAQATAQVTTTDARGRVLTLAKPGVLAQFRLIEMLGPETAKNQVYVAMVLPLMYLSAVDGEAIPKPSTKRELEALIQRLDEDGITAIAMGVEKNFGAPNPAGDEDRLKP